MAIVVYDGFSAALEHVLKNLPEEFEFCVAGWRFRDIESIVKARELSRIFNEFERKTHAQGYAITKSYDTRKPGEDYWVYHLKRDKPAEPATLPANAETVIDV